MAILPSARALSRPRNAPEYGIDVDVELVDQGAMTGVEFSVQLKATADAGDHPRVQIKLSTLNYWRQMSRPVLLVLWDERTDSLWCRWEHQIDTRKVRDGQKSLTVTFDGANILTAERWPEVEAEVRAAQCWGSAMIETPLGLEVRAAGTVAGNSAGVLRSIFLRELGRFEDLLKLGADGSPNFSITLGRGVIEVETRGGPGTIFHYEGLRSSVKLDSSRLVADAMIAVAAQLGRVGLGLQAARLVEEFWRDSAMAFQGGMASCARILLRADRIEEAIALVRSVDDVSAVPVGLAALSYEFQGTRWKVRLSQELESWAAAHGGIAESGDQAMTLEVAGRLLLQAEPSSALTLLERALALGVDDDNIAETLRVAGAAAFLSAEHEKAVEHYGRALHLGLSDVEPLLGDALLWSGQFRRAVQHLKFHAEGVDSDEFTLKAECFTALIDLFGIETQQRRGDEATALWWGGPPTLARCLEALALDMLCTPALQWLASIGLWGPDPEMPGGVTDCGLLTIEDCRVHAFDFALAAAFSAPSIPLLWEPLLLLCPIGRRDWTRAVVATAHRMCGEAIVSSLWEAGREEEAQLVQETFADADADAGSS